MATKHLEEYLDDWDSAEHRKSPESDPGAGACRSSQIHTLRLDEAMGAFCAANRVKMYWVRTCKIIFVVVFSPSSQTSPLILTQSSAASYTMPLYELLCLAQPALQRQDLVRMMRRVGDLVMDKGGVLTNIVSYGEQHLAYDIRRPFQRFSKVGCCSLVCGRAALAIGGKQGL
jgi:hypothetical protein